IIGDEVHVGMGMNVQVIPAGQYASCRTGVVGNDFDLPWTRLMRDWLPISGYQPADGPRYEIYHTDGSDDPDGRWDIEICLPVMTL
ncbi:MAG: GyrI-like domain-containing protein, partial [Rubripirellula sp.]